MMEGEARPSRLSLLLIILVLPALGIVYYAYQAFFTEPARQEASAPVLQAGGAVLRKLRGLSGESGGGAFLDLSPRGVPIAAWGGVVWDLGAAQPLLAAAEPALAGMAVTREGLVAVVRGDRLAYIHDGALAGIIPLPGPGYKVERAGERLCLYGPLPAQAAAAPDGSKAGAVDVHWAVYLLDRGRYAKLFTFPREITALAADEDGLFFASGGSVYRADFGRRLVPALYLPSGPRIRSLAWEPRRRALAISTERALYLLMAGRLSKLAEVSGPARFGAEGLYILAEGRRELLRLEGLFP